MTEQKKPSERITELMLKIKREREDEGITWFEAQSEAIVKYLDEGHPVSDNNK